MQSGSSLLRELVIGEVTDEVLLEAVFSLGLALLEPIALKQLGEARILPGHSGEEVAGVTPILHPLEPLAPEGFQGVLEQFWPQVGLPSRLDQYKADPGVFGVLANPRPTGHRVRRGFQAHRADDALAFDVGHTGFAGNLRDPGQVGPEVQGIAYGLLNP